MAKKCNFPKTKTCFPKGNYIFFPQIVHILLCKNNITFIFHILFLLWTFCNNSLEIKFRNDEQVWNTEQALLYFVRYSERLLYNFLTVRFIFTDFDGDDMLGINDLKQVIERLVGPDNCVSDNDIKQLIQNILAEADLDDDGALSFPEFEHIIDKSSDFNKCVLLIFI